MHPSAGMGIMRPVRLRPVCLGLWVISSFTLPQRSSNPNPKPNPAVIGRTILDADAPDAFYQHPANALRGTYPSRWRTASLVDKNTPSCPYVCDRRPYIGGLTVLCM